MAYPPEYVPSFNFTDFQTANPTTPLPGNKVDIELNNIETSITDIIANSMLIQRSDGALANESVGPDQLQSAVTLGLNTVTNWAEFTQYNPFNGVWYNSALYFCLVKHISSASFTADLAAGDWSVLVDFSIPLAAASASAATASTAAATAVAQGAIATTQAGNSSTSAAAALASQIASAASAASAGSSSTAASGFATAAGVSAAAAAAAAIQAAASLTGTSTTSLAIGTGSKTFTTQAGLSILVGAYVLAASNSGPTNFMQGQVTAYSGTSLTVNMLTTGGSGTKTDWNITVSAPSVVGGASLSVAQTWTALQNYALAISTAAGGGAYGNQIQPTYTRSTGESAALIGNYNLVTKVGAGNITTSGALGDGTHALAGVAAGVTNTDSGTVSGIVAYAVYGHGNQGSGTVGVSTGLYVPTPQASTSHPITTVYGILVGDHSSPGFGGGITNGYAISTAAGLHQFGGAVAIGNTPTTTAQLNVTAQINTAVVLQLQGTGAQTGALLTLSANGGIVGQVDHTGNFAIGSSSSPSNTLDVTGIVNSRHATQPQFQLISTAGANTWAWRHVASSSRIELANLTHATSKIQVYDNTEATLLAISEITGSGVNVGAHLYGPGAGNITQIASNPGALVLSYPPNEFLQQQSIQTTSATQTSMLAITPPATGDGCLVVDLTVAANRSSGAGTAGDSAGYKIFATYKVTSGTMTLVGSLNLIYTAESVSTYDATLAVVSNQATVKVTGVASTTINWFANARCVWLPNT